MTNQLHDGAAYDPFLPARWTDIAQVPSGLRTRLGTPVTRALFRAAVRDLPVRVEYPDGTVQGAAGAADPAAPRMLLHRPDDFFGRIANSGLIGFGEAYMVGDWSAPELTAVLTALASRIDTVVPAAFQGLRSVLLPRTPRNHRGAQADTRANIAHHYDLSNELFAEFLDETMTYSSALFVGAPATFDNLADAQRRKIDRLLDVARVGAGTRVLEIGTGSGYQAAILAELAAEVYTIEIIEALANRAAADLKRLGYTNVFVRAGDGYLGWPDKAPFDAIIVTCAPERVPAPLVEQLKEGGRMIIPVGPAGDQELVLLRKREGRLERKSVLPVRFVPMTGAARK